MKYILNNDIFLNFVGPRFYLGRLTRSKLKMCILCGFGYYAGYVDSNTRINIYNSDYGYEISDVSLSLVHLKNAVYIK